MTAGKRIRAVAAFRPAQFVVFDVLAAGGEDLRSRPLRERRHVLERALSGLGSPIVLCQQTEDLIIAREWLNTLTAGGIEGVVVEDLPGTIPPETASDHGGSTRPKRRLTCSPSGSPARAMHRAR